MVVALVQGLLGRDIQALRWAAIAVQLGIPEHVPPVPNIRSQAARRAGAHEEAIQHLLVLIPPPQRDTGTIRAIRQVHDALGDPLQRAAGVAAIRELPAGFALGPVASTLLSFLIDWATLLGELDLAFELANEMVDEYELKGAMRGTLAPLWLPEMLPFRRDPRFGAFAARLRWPEFWKRYGPRRGRLAVALPSLAKSGSVSRAAVGCRAPQGMSQTRCIARRSSNAWPIQRRIVIAMRSIARSWSSCCSFSPRAR